MLKRMLSLLITLSLVFAMITVSNVQVSAHPTASLIYSSDFESGTTGIGKYTCTSVTHETTTVHNGSGAVKVTKTEDYEYSYANGIENKMEPGKTYRFAMWVYVDGASTETTNFQLAPFYKKDGATNWHDGFIKVKTVTKGQWEYVEKDYTLPESAEAGTNQMQFQVDGANLVYYIDDLAIYEVVPNPEETLVYSNDFEANSDGMGSNGGTAGRVTTLGHSGTASYRHSKNSAYVYLAPTALSSKAMNKNDAYRISAWVYIESGGSDTTGKMCLESYNSTTGVWNSPKGYTIAAGIPTGSWTYVEFDYINRYADGNVITLYFNMVGASTVWYIDDIAIYKLGDTPEYEVIYREGMDDRSFNTSNNNASVLGYTPEGTAKRGGHSAQIQVKQSGGYTQMGDLKGKLEAGETYVFEAWVKSESGDADFLIYPYYVGYDEQGTKVVNYKHISDPYLGKYTMSTTDWTYVRYEYAFPELASMETMDFMINPFNVTTGTETIYRIDDIKVSRLIPEAAEVKSIEGIENGDGTGVKGLTVTYSSPVTAESAMLTTNYTLNGVSDLIKSVTNVSGNVYYVEFTEILPAGDYTFAVNGIVDAYYSTTLESSSIDFTCAAEIRTDVKIYKDYGTEKQYLITDGALMSGDLTAVVEEFGNYCNDAANPMVVIALYDGITLVDAKAANVNIGANSELSTPLTAALTVPEFDESTDYTIKAFLWEKEDLKPYTEVAELIEPEIVTLTVDPNDGDFASPCLANASISDSGPLKQYIIDIAPGTYTEVNWCVADYVTLRGQNKETCILAGDLGENAPVADITAQSTINMYGTASLENLTITAKNMRYPVHDEGSGSNKNVYRSVKNCVIEHLGNEEAKVYWAEEDPTAVVWQYISPWGFGSASGMVCVFENTDFKSSLRGWYVHNNKNFELPQRNVLINCTTAETDKGLAVTVDNLGSGTNDTIVLNGCTAGGQYIQFNDLPYDTGEDVQTASHNDYSVEVVNSSPLGFRSLNHGRALRITSNDTGMFSSVTASGAAADCLLGEYTTEKGGGGAGAYLYGYWDISGMPESGATNNYNTMGKRLGDCTGTGKTLELTFELQKVTVTFDKDYTGISNSAILSEINAAIAEYGVADIYDVDANEYYPVFVGKEFTAANNTETVIERFSPVCIASDGSSVELMTSSSTGAFAGITLERIVPGDSGRILTEGYLENTQMGISDTLTENSVYTVDTNGKFAIAANGSGILTVDNDNGWARFSAASN